MRSRTRTNIPVQKILEAQNMIDQQHNAVNIPLDDQPVPPSRTRQKKDDRRGGGKTEAQMEGEAQDILERLKKLWALEVWYSVHEQSNMRAYRPLQGNSQGVFRVDRVVTELRGKEWWLSCFAWYVILEQFRQIKSVSYIAALKQMLKVTVIKSKRVLGCIGKRETAAVKCTKHEHFPLYFVWSCKRNRGKWNPRL